MCPGNLSPTLDQNIMCFSLPYMYFRPKLLSLSDDEIIYLIQDPSSSKLTNGIVQNLYRFSIDLLPLNNVSERAKFVAYQFPTRRLGWLVNQ